MGDGVNHPIGDYLCHGSSSAPFSSIKDQYFRYFKNIE